MGEPGGKIFSHSEGVFGGYPVKTLQQQPGTRFA